MSGGVGKQVLAGLPPQRDPKVSSNGGEEGDGGSQADSNKDADPNLANPSGANNKSVDPIKLGSQFVDPRLAGVLNKTDAHQSGGDTRLGSVSQSGIAAKSVDSQSGLVVKSGAGDSGKLNDENKSSGVSQLGRDPKPGASSQLSSKPQSVDAGHTSQQKPDDSQQAGSDTNPDKASQAGVGTKHVNTSLPLGSPEHVETNLARNDTKPVDTRQAGDESSGTNPSGNGTQLRTLKLSPGKGQEHENSGMLSYANAKTNAPCYRHQFNT